MMPIRKIFIYNSDITYFVIAITTGYKYRNHYYCSYDQFDLHITVNMSLFSLSLFII